MNLVERMSTASVMVLSVLVILIILTSGLMMRLKPGGITFKKITYLSIIALLFTISSLFWTKDTAYDRDTLKHLEFGWPIPFVMQNQEQYEPPFPYAMIFSWGGLSEVVWEKCFASFAMNFFVLFAVSSLCSSLLGRNRGMKR